MDKIICVLSGLEIPKIKASREHYVPRSRVPKYIWNNPRNIFWTHYMLNAVKSNYLGCEWEDLKFALTYKAIKNWNLKSDDREFLINAMNNWEQYKTNPCDLCILKCKTK